MTGDLHDRLKLGRALRHALLGLALSFATTPDWLGAQPTPQALASSATEQTDCTRWRVRVRNRGEFGWAAYTYLGEIRPNREVPLDPRRWRGVFLGNVVPRQTLTFFLPKEETHVWLEIVLPVSTGFQPRPIVVSPRDSLADRYRGPDAPDVDFECDQG